MGGSGGGGFFHESSKSPQNIAKEIREKEKKTLDDYFDTDVTNLIRQVLATANDRDTYSVQNHLNTIEAALHSDVDGFIDLRYAGSVSKHTYVDGLSDIDTLAIINKSDLVNYSPDAVKQYFFDRLKQRLPNSDIRIGNLAVTVRFTSGFEIQVLPVMKDLNGIKIPSSRRENEWSHIIKPEKFAKILRYTNSQMSGKLIPVIKLAKSIIASFGEARRMAGYHVEALAVEVFGHYTGAKSPKIMLQHFFSEGSKYVLTPVRDKTGQSIHVDDYLGQPGSVSRKMVSDSLATVARKMQNADGSREIRIWEQLLK